MNRGKIRWLIAQGPEEHKAAKKGRDREGGAREKGEGGRGDRCMAKAKGKRRTGLRIKDQEKGREVHCAPRRGRKKMIGGTGERNVSMGRADRPFKHHKRKPGKVFWGWG